MGPVDNVYSGGYYRVYFTDNYNCVSDTDRFVPYAPETYFPYFPQGCYTLCDQELPVTLHGVPPPDAFTSFAWLRNGAVVSSGGGTAMTPYDVVTAGDYQWALNNGLCTQTSGDLDISTVDCHCNPPVTPSWTATVTCNPATPISYDMDITYYAPLAGSTYKLGTNKGPILPFSGTFTSGAPVTLHLSYTFVEFLGYRPPYILIESQTTMPGGGKCFDTLTVPLPPCVWTDEARHADTSHHAVTQVDQPALIDNALLVYPNPSTGNVTASYDYGMHTYTNRSLTVYDALGRLMQRTEPQDIHGSWNISAAGWVPGMYIIRMEGDGKALQTGKVIITH